MTREQAKEILSMYRAKGADAADPFFAEALEAANSDSTLKSWLNEQQDFDARVSGAFNNLMPPSELKQELLRIATPAPRWWNRPLGRREFAAAATIALLCGAVVLFNQNRSENAMSVRDRAIEASWSSKRHVRLETSNLAEIRRFIAAHDIPGDFKLPPELASMRPRGCSLLSVGEHRVPFICFVDELKHLHLLVMDKDLCSVTAPSSPEFDRWQNVTLTTWTKGNQTFVLTGMSPLQFVKKFRRERQWSWDG